MEEGVQRGMYLRTRNGGGGLWGVISEAVCRQGFWYKMGRIPSFTMKWFGRVFTEGGRHDLWGKFSVTYCIYT